MSCRTLVVALVLVASPLALAQVPGEDEAGADAGALDVGRVGGCLPTDANQDGVIDAAGGCGVEDGGSAGQRALEVDWRTIEIDQELNRLGALPPVAPRPRDADERRSGASSVSPRRPMSGEPRWTVDFDTVLGQRSNYLPRIVVPEGSDCASSPIYASYLCPQQDALAATVSGFSVLARVQYRATERLTIGAVVPLGFGHVRSIPWVGPPYNGTAWPDETYGNLGALALSGTWEARAAHTRIPVGLLLAFPTWVGPPSEAPVLLAEGTRAFEDRELFYRGVALVPSASMVHDFGRVEVAVSAKVPLRLNDYLHKPTCYGPPCFWFPAPIVDVVGAAQVMAQAVDRPGVVVSGGVRAFTMFSTWWGFSLALEPRVEALLGALALRAGFIIPLAVNASRCDAPACYDGWNTGRFPEAWGVRLGVGYSF